MAWMLVANRAVLIDTGALVAFLSLNDRYHLWAAAAFKKLPAMMISCEAVLSETFFVLQKYNGGTEVFRELLRRKPIHIVSLQLELDSILELMAKYSNVPMSYADACLVRLAELTRDSAIVTTDSDFATYRMKKNQKIPLVAPK